MSKRSKKALPQPPSKRPKPDILVHPQNTRSGKKYKFTKKHHYPTCGENACWKREISRDQEFGLFSQADELHLCDEDQNLYNVDRQNEEYMEIGTRHELVAKFWNTESQAEWHGFPMWPILTRSSLNRKGQQYRPPKYAMEQMVRHGRISQRDADRILSGDHP